MGKTFSTGLLTNGVFQDSSNNIGIGAAPSGSYKLEVTGTAKVSSTLLLGGALTGTSATFSGNVGIGIASSTFALDTLLTDASTNTILGVAQIGRATTGTAANGIGGNIQFTAEDTAGNQRTAAYITWKLAAASSASPQGYLSIGSRNASEALIIADSGAATFSSSVTATQGLFNSPAYGTYPLVISNAGVYTSFEINNTYSNAANRNWAIVCNVGTFGDFGIVQSNTQGGSATNGTPKFRIIPNGFTKLTTNATYRDSTNGHEASDNSADDINHFTVWAQNSSCLGALIRIAGSRSSTNNTYKFINATNGNDTGIFNVLDSGNCQNTNSSYGGTSDVKLKQDIIDASSQWDDIKQIRVRKFRFKKQVEVDENAPYLLGVVAQEIETTSPNLVEEVADKNKDGTESTTKSVKYSVIYMKAVKALQEAMQRIETLESTITLLNERLTKAAL